MSAVTATGPTVIRDLLATGASVGLARSVASYSLRGWGLGPYEERALAIVSELVTNAVAVSAAAETVRLCLTIRAEWLVIGVSDTVGERMPQARVPVSNMAEIDEADSEAFGGWGLMIISAYADEVWAEPAQDGAAKWVCAAIGIEGAR